MGKSTEWETGSEKNGMGMGRMKVIKRCKRIR